MQSSIGFFFSFFFLFGWKWKGRSDAKGFPLLWKLSCSSWPRGLYLCSVSTCVPPLLKQWKSPILSPGYKRIRAYRLCRLCALHMQCKPCPMRRHPTRGAVQQPAHSPEKSQPQWRRKKKQRTGEWMNGEGEREESFQTGWPTFNTVWRQTQRERRGRERERDKRMQRAYRNGKHSDDTAGEKDEKERMPKQRNIETNRGPSISGSVNLSILFIHSSILFPYLLSAAPTINQVLS